MTTDEIAASISARLEELSGEIHQLTAARDALLQNAARDQMPGQKAPASRTRRRPRTKRQAVSADQLQQLLSAGGQTTTASLAEETGASQVRILTLLRELETAGQVRRTGQRRGTRWDVVTDEDRIAARAAELSARPARQ